jgi:hypothetical protein
LKGDYKMINKVLAARDIKDKAERGIAMTFTTLKRKTFGRFARYQLVKCRTRFGDIVYFVNDAERPDEYGLPTTIRQAATAEEAVAGLDAE